MTNLVDEIMAMTANPTVAPIAPVRSTTSIVSGSVGYSITDKGTEDTAALLEGLNSARDAAIKSSTELANELVKISNKAEPQHAVSEEAAAKIAIQAEKAKLETLQTTRELYKATGGNQILMNLAKRQGELTKQAASATDAAMTNMNTSIQDDGIMKFFGSRLLMQAKNKEAKAANSAVKANAELISQVNDTMTEANKAITLVEEVRTGETLAAFEDQQLANIELARLQRKANTAGIRTKAVNGIFKMTIENIEAAVKLRTEDNYRRSLGVQDRAAAEKEKDLTDITELANRVKVVGGDKKLYTKEEISTILSTKGPALITLQEHIAKGVKLRETDPQYQRQLESGTESISSLGPNFGTSVVAAAYLETNPVAKDNRFADSIRAVAEKTAHELALKDIDITKLPEEDYVSALNETAEVYYKDQRDNIPAGGKGVYSADPYPVLADIPAIQNTKLHQLVLKDLGMKTMDEQLILDAAIAGAQNREDLSLEEAMRDVVSIFTVAAHQNNNMNNYALLGIPMQDSYKLKLYTQPKSFSPMYLEKGVFVITPKIDPEGRTTHQKNLPRPKEETSMSVTDRLFGRGGVTVDLMQYDQLMNYAIQRSVAINADNANLF